MFHSKGMCRFCHGQDDLRMGLTLTLLPWAHLIRILYSPRQPQTYNPPAPATQVHNLLL